MNWMAPQFEEATLNQKLIHFVGGSKSMIPRYHDHLPMACPTISPPEASQSRW